MIYKFYNGGFMDYSFYWWMDSILGFFILGVSSGVFEL